MDAEGVERFDLEGDDGDDRGGVSLSVLIGNLEALRDRFGDMPVSAGAPDGGGRIHVGIYEDGEGRMMTLGDGSDMMKGMASRGHGGPDMVATDWRGDAHGSLR